jgi:NAD(P)H-quinone oxidoreductase subunit 5
MNTLGLWCLLVPVAALAVPVTLASTALAAPRRAELASGAALVLGLFSALGSLVLRHVPMLERPGLGVRVDLVTAVMITLIGSLGYIVVRYSRNYLKGEPGVDRYLRWLLLALSAVSTLVIANNLLLIVLCWTATSIALHQLLTFYPNRTQALVAAHKKFLVSRLADIALLVSLGLVHQNVGSFNLDRIAAWADSHHELSPSMHIAAVLMVLAVALRSAQLPFHGWLIQVMEAPTPVSALLHAGVVNIGGFVLIRLSPWMSHAPAAQMLLVVVGLVSAVVAALVMTTRVSVKVALAWSTCAQMGFMLVQCGLGLWHLALLHLVAHSLYKAHAFLSAGTAVEVWKIQSQSKPLASLSTGRFLVAVTVAITCSVAAIALLLRLVSLSTNDRIATAVLSLIVGLSMVPLLSRSSSSALSTAIIMIRGGIVVLLYAGWHVVAAHLVPQQFETSHATSWVLVAVGLSGLFIARAALQLLPTGRFAQTLHPWLFAGLYLDEWFTRLTFRLWPPRLPLRADAHQANRTQELIEAQV